MDKKLIQISTVILIILIMGGVIFFLFENEKMRNANHIPEDWPSKDSMVENLTEKGYKIITDDEIVFEGKTYKGERLKATKGKHFIDVFWSNDQNINTQNIIERYYAKTYDSDYILSLNYTVYCGTKKSIKDSGVRLR